MCHESDLVMAQTQLEDLGAVFKGLLQSLETGEFSWLSVSKLEAPRQFCTLPS